MNGTIGRIQSWAKGKSVIERVLAGAAAIALLVFVVAVGAVLAVAVLAFAALITAGVAVAWLFSRAFGGRRRRQGPRVLVARKGPHGWTVDA